MSEKSFAMEHLGPPEEPGLSLSRATGVGRDGKNSKKPRQADAVGGIITFAERAEISAPVPGVDFLLTTIAQVKPSYGKKLHEHLQHTQP